MSSKPRLGVLHRIAGSCNLRRDAMPKIRGRENLLAATKQWSKPIPISLPRRRTNVEFPSYGASYIQSLFQRSSSMVADGVTIEWGTSSKDRERHFPVVAEKQEQSRKQNLDIYTYIYMFQTKLLIAPCSSYLQLSSATDSDCSVEKWPQEGNQSIANIRTELQQSSKFPLFKDFRILPLRCLMEYCIGSLHIKCPILTEDFDRTYLCLEAILLNETSTTTINKLFPMR